MNDRYLFKAKRKNWKELPKEEWWVVGYYLKRLDELNKEEHIIFICDGFYTEIDKSTLCQCTGLKDKNGKRIWENDAVRWQGKLYVVKWFDSICSFVLYRVCGHWNHMEMNYGQRLECFDYEVIGSCIDNPELQEAE